MSWWQLSVECSDEELEKTEDDLLSIGAIAITLADAEDEPLYEPLPGHTPVWKRSIVTGLFENDRPLESLYTNLVKMLSASLVSTIKTSSLQDEDWVAAYQRHFKPIQCTDDLWIVPEWCEAPDPDALNIILSPGVAFGTGGHPTTALCLEWLSNNKPSHLDCIDYGCGSGILAIAALKLGARQVIGVDIDPQALDSSRQNAERNQIDATQLPLLDNNQAITELSDLLIANILSAPLISMADYLASLIKPGGRIVLSGILQNQVDATKAAYQSTFEFDDTHIMEDWACITGIRRDG